MILHSGVNLIIQYIIVQDQNGQHINTPHMLIIPKKHSEYEYIEKDILKMYEKEIWQSSLKLILI